MVHTALQEARRAEDLLIGALAVLALRGVDAIRTTDKAFHTGFGAALKVFSEAGGEVGELATCYHRDVVSDTYDELDHALIAAEQFGLVRFPNPTYSRVQIAITPRLAEQLLAAWPGKRSVFEQAAETLYKKTYEYAVE